MGFWDRVRYTLGGDNTRLELAATVDKTAIDPALFGLASWGATGIYEVPARVMRSQALTVPAVKRARDKICGGLGGLPIFTLSRANMRGSRKLFEQPEKDIARSVTLAMTVEDLLFEGIAWWRIKSFGWDGFPEEVVRLDPRTVTIAPDQRVYVGRDGAPQGSAAEHVEDRLLIRFDSPHDPLLVVAARAIRTSMALDHTAAEYAETPQPMMYFEPRDPVIEPDLELQVKPTLEGWKAARQAGAIGYVGNALVPRQLNAWSPDELQLAEARQHAALEIARATGVDPEDLGVSTTSRTYANSADRVLSFQNDVLRPYANAITDRLSMPDVTPRGTRVRFDWAFGLGADEASRIATYAAGVDLGIYTVDDAAAREELPVPAPKPEPAPAPAPAPVDPAQHQEPQPMQNAAEPRLALARETGLTFDAPDAREAFSVDVEARTITGLVAPYGVTASKGGQRFAFAKGSLKFSDAGRVKLLRDHDPKQPLGVLIKATDTPAGMVAKYRVARGAAGDEALSLAQDGVLDGFSVGVDFNDEDVQYQKDGVALIRQAAWRETSLTAVPAFDDARVTSVTASRDSLEEPAVDETTTPAAPAATDASAVADAIREGFSALRAELPQRETVAAGRVPMRVSEAAPYRFTADGRILAGTHDFSSDVFAALKDGDQAAHARAIGALSESFSAAERSLAFETDVDTTDAAAVNPNRYRADLYVDQRQYRFPLWDAVRKETISDKTPLIVPKYSTSSGLVADHVEGTEPTAGTFTVTSQTVTPGAHSGRVAITRELWDMGGSPQVSNLIWAKMQSAFYEALEAKVNTVLTAAAASITDIALTTAGADSALSGELAAAISALQFVRGGFTFELLAAHIDLYQKLVAAKDGSNRPLFPILNPTNANGTAQTRFGELNVHGVRALPSWALGSTGTVSANSWLVDPAAVYAASSAPNRLSFEYRVAEVDLAIWGYSAVAVIDTAGLRQVTYDPI